MNKIFFAGALLLAACPPVKAPVEYCSREFALQDGGAFRAVSSTGTEIGVVKPLADGGWVLFYTPVIDRGTVTVKKVTLAGNSVTIANCIATVKEGE